MLSDTFKIIDGLQIIEVFREEVKIGHFEMTQIVGDRVTIKAWANIEFNGSISSEEGFTQTIECSLQYAGPILTAMPHRIFKEVYMIRLNPHPIWRGGGKNYW